MANKVYRWKKPELSITLTDGGSLQANTTYYLFAYICHHSGSLVWAYHLAHSPVSDVYSFTTTDTKKSISISWKTSGDITQFENVGSGQVRVYSAYHCLKTGNQITIMSGAYAGSYTITEETYNTFLINATYSGTYTTIWECYILPNDATSIKVYMHTSYPFDSDGVFIGSATKFSHNYTTNGYTTNPFSITAEFNTTYSSNNMWCGYLFPYKTYNELLYGVGKPVIYIDTGNTLISTIDQMLKDSGIENELNYVTSNSVRLNAHLKVVTSYAPVIENYTILLEASLLNWANATFSKCSINSTKLLVRAIMNAKFINSSIYVDTYCDNIGTNLGSNIYMLGYNIINNYYDGKNSKFILKSPSKTTLFSVNSLSSEKYVENFTVAVSQLYHVYALSSPVTTRQLRNITFDNEGCSYDIRVYSYNDVEIRAEYENIDTIRTNNRKVFVTQGGYVTKFDFVCIRKKQIKVVDKDNNPIYNAKIDVTDNQGSSYTFYTDSNGLATIEVIEQFTKVSNTYNDTGTNTYYEDFVITISKDGYRPQIYYFDYGKLISDYLDIICLSKNNLEISSLSFTHPSGTNNNGTITIDASGGSPPYYYSINDGESYESTNQFSNLSAGTYYIKVKDSEDSSTNSYEVKLTNTEYILYDPVYGNIEQTEISCNIDPTVIYGNIEQTEISGNVSDSIIYGNAEIDTVAIKL